MMNKEYMRKVYRHFGDFVAIAAAQELEMLICNADFTSSFNHRIKKIIDELEQEGNSMAKFSVLFNTEGEITIIDSAIVGKFIGERYTASIEGYYKGASLNKVIKSVVDGDEKAKQDFIVISYKIIYNTIKEMYMKIKSRKEALTSFKQNYNIIYYRGQDAGVVVGTFLILEDICKYIGLEEKKILEFARETLNKRSSQEKQKFDI